MFNLTKPIPSKRIPNQPLPSEIVLLKFLSRFGLALFMVSLVFAPRSAYACSCAAPLPPNEAMEEATAVFSGQVIEIQPSEGRLDITFVVNQEWKGEIEDTIVVRTATSTAMCGYGFDVGQSYLVYAHERRGRLQTNQCSRTVLLRQATDDLSALGEPQAQSCQEPDE